MHVAVYWKVRSNIAACTFNLSIMAMRSCRKCIYRCYTIACCYRYKVSQKYCVHSGSLDVRLSVLLVDARLCVQ